MEADQAMSSAVVPQLCPGGTKKNSVCPETTSKGAGSHINAKAGLRLIHFVLLLREALGSSGLELHH